MTRPSPAPGRPDARPARAVAEHGRPVRWPAEWEPHAATWMAWPVRAALWGERVERVRDQYAEVARAIAQFEPVVMVAPAEHAEDARRRCGDVRIAVEPIDDGWLRDSGPTFTVRADGGLAGAAWRFNAWGGKHHPFAADAGVGARVLRRAGARVDPSTLTAEGGAIAGDGGGTLITTESCLLNPNRNPGWTKREVEAELRRTLGIATVVWLPGDPDDGETDGHVDGLAAFVAPGRVVHEAPLGRSDPRFAVLEENRRALASARDARGSRLTLLPLPHAYDDPRAGERDCRSYVNFYLANGGCVVPRYGSPRDAEALEALAGCLPGRRVVGVDVREIARGGGAVHCITQQQPAAPA